MMAYCVCALLTVKIMGALTCSGLLAELLLDGRQLACTAKWRIHLVRVVERGVIHL